MAKLNSGEVKSAILQVLNAAPSGKTGNEVAAVLGKCRSNTTTRLSELYATGRVIRVIIDGPPKRKLWFAPKFAEQAAKAGTVQHWDFSGSKMKRKHATTIAGAMKPAPRRPGDPVRVVAAAPLVDMRYHVDKPNPVFSGLRPGQYPVSTGSAIERAYS